MVSARYLNRVEDTGDFTVVSLLHINSELPNASSYRPASKPKTATLNNIAITRANLIMSKPTKLELQEAIEEATRMRDKGEDPHYIAKSLLNCNYRINFLEHVMDSAKHYLHSGLAAHEHTILIQTISAAETASRELEEEKIDFGLDSGE